MLQSRAVNTYMCNCPKRINDIGVGGEKQGGQGQSPGSTPHQECSVNLGTVWTICPVMAGNRFGAMMEEEEEEEVICGVCGAFDDGPPDLGDSGDLAADFTTRPCLIPGAHLE